MWVSIPGWPYEVSDAGAVRNLLTSRELKPIWTGSKRKQYATVRLSNMGTWKDFKVHQLVCELFISPRPTGMLALHKDDDTQNNSVGNLYWGSPSDNARDVGKRKPTAAVAALIRQRRAAGESGAALSREYGVSQQLICDIVKYRSYKYV